jgi:hypothetical protein
VRKVLGLRTMSPGLVEGSLLTSEEHPLLLYCDSRVRKRGQEGRRTVEWLVVRRMVQYVILCRSDTNWGEMIIRISCGIQP